MGAQGAPEGRGSQGSLGPQAPWCPMGPPGSLTQTCFTFLKLLKMRPVYLEGSRGARRREKESGGAPGGPEYIQIVSQFDSIPTPWP